MNVPGRDNFPKYGKRSESSTRYLASMLCLLMLVAFVTRHEALAENTKPTRAPWHVLVFDRTWKQGHDLPYVPQPESFEGDPSVDQSKFITEDSGAYHKGDFTTSRWHTIHSDGAICQRIPGLLVNLDGKIVRLKWKRTTFCGRCKDGNWPYKSQADLLIAEFIGDRYQKVICRSAQKRAKEMIELMPDLRKDRERPLESWKDTKYNVSLAVLGINGNCVSLAQYLTGFAAGGTHVNTPEEKWSNYRIKGGALVPANIDLPASVLVTAKQLLSEIPENKRGACKSPYEDLSGPAFRPRSGGLDAEYAVTFCRNDDFNGIYARVHLPGRMLPADATEINTFVSAHTALVPWDRTDFYSICPDFSAVAYGLSGKLFWQPLQGQRKWIGNYTEVRGVQWLNGTRLTARELTFLQSAKSR